MDTEPGDTIYVEPGTYEENLAIGSPDAGTDPGSAPKRDLRIVGQRRPTVDGFVQILDPGITFEGFEVTGVTNGIFLGRKDNVLAENCLIENYSGSTEDETGRFRLFGRRATILSSNYQ